MRALVLASACTGMCGVYTVAAPLIVTLKASPLMVQAVVQYKLQQCAAAHVAAVHGDASAGFGQLIFVGI